jgi:Mrp family chromosome partitioning ATPase
MFSLSQTTGYAILALGLLHKSGDRLVLAKDITQRTQIPLPYLSKILNALTRTGLIVGKSGVGKTTLASILAMRLATLGRPVIAVYADPDGNLAAALGIAR